MQEERLLELIVSEREQDRKEAFDFLYKSCRSTIEKYLSGRGASKVDIEDVFQDSLFILYKNVVSGSFKGKSSLSTYLVSICKYQWFDKVKMSVRVKKTSLQDDYEEDFEPDPYAKISLERVHAIVKELSEGCQKILIDYYFKKMPLKSIMEKVQLGSVQAVKNKKSKCMKKLVEIVKVRRLNVEDFSYE